MGYLRGLGTDVFSSSFIERMQQNITRAREFKFGLKEKVAKTTNIDGLLVALSNLERENRWLTEQVLIVLRQKVPIAGGRPTVVFDSVDNARKMIPEMTPVQSGYLQSKAPGLVSNLMSLVEIFYSMEESFNFVDAEATRQKEIAAQKAAEEQKRAWADIERQFAEARKAEEERLKRVAELPLVERQVQESRRSEIMPGLTMPGTMLVKSGQPAFSFDFLPGSQPPTDDEPTRGGRGPGLLEKVKKYWWVPVGFGVFATAYAIGKGKGV